MPERDVLSQARKLEREIEDGDAVARVAYADWLIHEGLRQEGFDEIDRVLRDDPNQTQARKLLVSTEFDVGLPDLAGPTEELPDRVDALIRAAAQVASPAAREIAVQRLAELGDDYLLLPDLQAALDASSPRRRAFATLALRRLFPGQEVRHLVMRSILDASDEVRLGASLALGDVDDPAVVLPAIKALESSSALVRTNAAEALGNMGYPAAVAALMARLNTPQSGGGYVSPRSHIFIGKQFAYIQDFDVEVAQFEAVADPQINVLIEGVVLDARVIGVHIYTTPAERSAIRGSLRQLTGANPGTSVRAWNRWWDDNQSAYVSDAGAASPTPPATAAAGG